LHLPPPVMPHRRICDPLPARHPVCRTIRVIRVPRSLEADNLVFNFSANSPSNCSRMHRLLFVFYQRLPCLSFVRL
jgi:hypothetical protein